MLWEGGGGQNCKKHNLKKFENISNPLFYVVYFMFSNSLHLSSQYDEYSLRAEVKKCFVRIKSTEVWMEAREKLYPVEHQWYSRFLR